MATVYTRLLLRMTVSLTLTRLHAGIPDRLPSRGNENLEALSSSLAPSSVPLRMPTATLLKERERTT